MRTTQRKGDYAVARAIATFTKASMDVSLPLTESAAYDIVVDDNGRLFRVQVRYVSGREVELRRIHSNSTGYVVKKTLGNAYDWLYILNSADEEFLIKECLSGRRSIRTQKIHEIKNSLVTSAEDLSSTPVSGTISRVRRSTQVAEGDGLLNR